MSAGASLFCQSTDTNVHGTGSVKIRKTRHKISVRIGPFLQCIPVRYDAIINVDELRRCAALTTTSKA